MMAHLMHEDGRIVASFLDQGTGESAALWLTHRATLHLILRLVKVLILSPVLWAQVRAFVTLLALVGAILAVLGVAAALLFAAVVP